MNAYHYYTANCHIHTAEFYHSAVQLNSVYIPIRYWQNLFAYIWDLLTGV